jgi:hypothetical protein
MYLPMPATVASEPDAPGEPKSGARAPGWHGAGACQLVAQAPSQYTAPLLY